MFTSSVAPPTCQRAIRRLPDELINQIAAGEVVERPASVIKELVENSLDAGSTQIEILLKAGGLEEIQVLDNGHGIPASEFPLAVERHATSKIVSSDDLNAIHTFGFRGEALSSICSVAEVSLISRTPEAHSGYQMHIRQGVIESLPTPLGAPAGTCITVSHLFSRIPGRRKFLRSPATELSHCQRIVKELALANPGTRFYLKHEGRALGSWLTTTRKERFTECLKLPAEPLCLQELREDMALEAYLSPPELGVARAELYLFINGRPVKNRSFLSAIRTAYIEQPGFSGEPIGVCYLDIRKDWVDVNVHPQKWEVRCLQQESIYYWLLSCFRKFFSQTKSTPQTPIPQRIPSFAASSGTSSLIWEPAFSFRFVARTSKVLIAEEANHLLIGDVSNLYLKSRIRKLLAGGGESTIERENLPLPKICRLSSENLRLWETLKEALQRLGFDSTSFGDHDVAIQSKPDFFPESRIEDFLSPLLLKLESLQFSADNPSHWEQMLTFLMKESINISEPLLTVQTNELMQEMDLLMKETTPSTPTGVVRIPFSTLNEWEQNP